MKALVIFKQIAVLSLIFSAACTHESSPADIQSKITLIARSWTGDRFDSYSSGDTLRVAKTWIVRMDFTADGSFHLVYAIDSGPGRWGQWRLGDNGNIVRLTADSLHTGDFPVVELSPSRFVFGDTTCYGYSLIPRPI